MVGERERIYHTASTGITSNLFHPPSKASWDILTQAVYLTLATLLVATRMYTKFKVLRNAGWDDCESKTCLMIRIILLPDFRDTSFLAWVRFLFSRTSDPSDQKLCMLACKAQKRSTLSLETERVLNVSFDVFETLFVFHFVLRLFSSAEA